jgi:hypothetical protein
VLAVDVFTRVAGDERADVVSLVEGLDMLAAREVRLFNLSLAGPQNAVLTRMIDRLTDPVRAGCGDRGGGGQWRACGGASMASGAPKGRCGDGN